MRFVLLGLQVDRHPTLMLGYDGLGATHCPLFGIGAVFVVRQRVLMLEILDPRGPQVVRQ